MADIFKFLKTLTGSRGREGDGFVIFGLGNPGPKYESTRHNAGFLVIDELARRLNCPPPRLARKGLIYEGRRDGNRIWLVKPQTYMNLSGDCVAEVLRYHKLGAESALIIFDDMMLDVGTVRIRKNGSHGGHNGMRSVTERMGTDGIARIKVGVGKKPHLDYDGADWVMGKIPPAKKEVYEKSIADAADAALLIASGDIDEATNRYSH